MGVAIREDLGQGQPGWCKVHVSAVPMCRVYACVCVCVSTLSKYVLGEDQKKRYPAVCVMPSVSNILTNAILTSDI